MKSNNKNGNKPIKSGKPAPVSDLLMRIPPLPDDFPDEVPDCLPAPEKDL
jgi:hypothetical protein